MSKGALISSYPRGDGVTPRNHWAFAQRHLQLLHSLEHCLDLTSFVKISDCRSFSVFTTVTSSRLEKFSKARFPYDRPDHLDLSLIQAIEVILVARIVSNRLGSVSI